MPGNLDPAAVIMSAGPVFTPDQLAAERAAWDAAVEQAVPGRPALLLVPRPDGRYFVIACSGPDQPSRVPTPAELARLGASLRSLVVDLTVNPDTDEMARITLSTRDDTHVRSVLAAALAAGRKGA